MRQLVTYSINKMTIYFFHLIDICFLFDCLNPGYNIQLNNFNIFS